MSENFRPTSARARYERELNPESAGNRLIEILQSVTNQTHA